MTRELDVRASCGADGAAKAPVVVRVAGEIDIHHASDFAGRFSSALSAAKPTVPMVVDLSNSSFCDSSGLNALMRARTAALLSGHPFSLAAPSHQMLRLLDLTGTTELFPVQPAAPPSAATPSP